MLLITESTESQHPTEDNKNTSTSVASYIFQVNVKNDLQITSIMQLLNVSRINAYQADASFLWGCGDKHGFDMIPVFFKIDLAKQSTLYVREYSKMNDTQCFGLVVQG